MDNILDTISFSEKYFALNNEARLIIKRLLISDFVGTQCELAEACGYTVKTYVCKNGKIAYGTGQFSRLGIHELELLDLIVIVASEKGKKSTAFYSLKKDWNNRLMKYSIQDINTILKEERTKYYK